MNSLIYLHNTFFRALERAADSWLLPTLARFTFSTTLLFYFWTSVMTKTGDGITGLFRPSLGAYAQIFPRQMEAVGYDVAQLGAFHWLVVLAGTYAEFLLPALIVLGLATRLAALGMIGFVTLQSLTDLYGHGGIAQPDTLGAWFDRFPDGVILDQRLFWVLTLMVLVVKGAGPLSLDRLLRPQAASG
jgi:putative oxidoreductase